MLNRRTFTAVLASFPFTSVLARAEPEFEARPDFGKRFEEVGTQGVFVAYRLRDNRLIVTDEGRARLEYVPASTYKVPHALIALETGVVADADKELIRWDGQVRSIEAWNKDHTLRSAMAVSAVPVFQQIARRIGSERMKKYLDAFRYGNREVGSQIDRFWLDGPLKTSALDQIEFFEKLRSGELPLTDRTLTLGRDVIPSEAVSGGALRYKTGAVGIDGTSGEKSALGWIAGYVDRGEDSSIFAMNLDVHGQPDLARRLPIAKSILAEVGAI
jgi:beta-lactamase class D